MKIDIEKTSELKNLLKVGTEHTVGYQGSTRKQGIVADSIMVAEVTLYSKAANNNVEEVFAVEEIKEKDPIDNISVNSNKDNDSKPSGIGCEKDDDELSTKSESSTYEKVITMHDYIDCDQNNNTTKDEEWCDVDVLRKEKKTKAVTVSSEDVTLIGKLEVHPGLYDDSPTGFKNLFSSQCKRWDLIDSLSEETLEEEFKKAMKKRGIDLNDLKTLKGNESFIKEIVAEIELELKPYESHQVSHSR